MVLDFQPPASNNKSYNLTLKGNQLFEKQLYVDAIHEYTKAMEHATTADYLALLYSNRCTCYLHCGKYAAAHMDAEKVIQLAPDWPKGYYRVGQAKLKLRQFDEAIQQFRRALEMEPENQEISLSLGRAVIDKDNEEMGVRILQLQVGRDLAVHRPSISNPIQRQIFDFAKQMHNIVYVIVDVETKHCVVVDACWDVDGLCQFLDEQEYSIVASVVTHSHFDHVGGQPPSPYDTLPIKIAGLGSLLKRYPHIKAYIHADDIAAIRVANPSIPINRLVASCTDVSSELTIGKRTQLQFLHTPGHTPGSQSILVNASRLIAGDTLLCGGLCGRTDLPGGDRRQLEHTLRYTLGQLDDRIVVYPGHNYGVPWSTIAIEREKGCLGEDLVGFGMHPSMSADDPIPPPPTSKRAKRASVSSVMSNLSVDVKRRPLSLRHPPAMPAFIRNTSFS
ncbi:beta-lactamase-like protein [Gongronella butleri]|nr:beta-lactamase-like protein [Gongronella butleri]